MQLRKWFVNVCSLYSQWNKNEREEWLKLREMSFIGFYFRKNFHVYGICLLSGMLIATWLNFRSSGPEYNWLAGICISLFLSIAASGLYALFTRKLTSIAFAESTKD